MKNALIIGGSTGMGLDTAKRLAARGVAVTISGREGAKLKQAAAELKQAGATKVVTKSVDLYDRAQVDAFAGEIAAAPAHDYLVNSAADVAFHGSTLEATHQAERLRGHGLIGVSWHPFTFGIATLYVGTKPVPSGAAVAAFGRQARKIGLDRSSLKLG